MMSTQKKTRALPWENTIEMYKNSKCKRKYNNIRFILYEKHKKRVNKELTLNYVYNLILHTKGPCDNFVPVRIVECNSVHDIPMSFQS